MSGNFTQRGEPAAFGKDVRAKIAVDAGASLVLELPFPYSAAGAEFFAFAAVYIANAIGVVDALSFGSESGSLEALSLCAERLASPLFEKALFEKAKEKNNSLGTATLSPLVYQELYKDEEGASLFSSPNNLLALSYLKALKKLNSTIAPHTVRRLGDYRDDKGASFGYASASYLRSLLSEGKLEEALFHMPTEAHKTVKEALEGGRHVLERATYGALVLSHFRLHKAPLSPIAEAEGGLYRRIAKSAESALDFDSLVSLGTTKKYPAARIRRAALFSLLSVSPKAVRQAPLYTQVLAMDEKGQALLREIRKKSQIPVYTKPSAYKNGSEAIKEAAERAASADALYTLLSPTANTADYYLRTSPYRK